MKLSLFVFGALVATSAMGCEATSALAGERVTAPDFRWGRALGAPTRLEVYTTNGSIRVESGPTLEVVGTKKGKKDDLAKVTIDVKEEAGVIAVCARWPGQSECRVGGPTGSSSGSGNLEASFVIHVPANVTAITAASHNGSVTANAPAETVRARTDNGAIDVETNGAVDAETQNGAVTAHLAKSKTAKLVTQNGSVTAVLPKDADAEVEASTQVGSIASDFGDVPAAPFPGVSNKVHLRLGAGGTKLTLTTQRGAVHLQRS